MKQTPCVPHVRTTDGRREIRWDHLSDDIPFYVCTIKVHWRFAERQRYGSVMVNGNQHQQDSSKSVKQFWDELTYNWRQGTTTTMLSQCVRDFVSRKRVWSVLHCNSDRDLTMEGTRLQGALPSVWIIIHKPSTTVILRPFHLVSHPVQQCFSLIKMCRPTVMHVFMFREGFILETISYPTDRPTSTSGAVPPGDRNYTVASGYAKNGAPWLCGNFSCMSVVSVALDSGEPLLIHFYTNCVEKRRVSSWPDVHRPRLNLSIHKSRHPWPNIGANQWDRHTSFLLP